jgi:hypothetical protein
MLSNVQSQKHFMKREEPPSQQFHVKRSLGLAPTTEMGKHHEIISHELENRESNKIGNQNPGQMGASNLSNSISQSVNDPHAHRAWMKQKKVFNVLTGGFQKRL